MVSAIFFFLLASAWKNFVPASAGISFLGTNCSEKIPLFDVLFYNGECFINASLQGISGVFIYFSDETLL
jgi:hypothetical protein